ncbi:hypothetical protein N7462_009919 [Penicillium macrosclerotiorum]|uniref:uncharacterized protein n=1 Tax=Penicillium macrosclerotiorum TaxID=303699 RepID=UPI0025498E3B|nr:uncharacterized protein N7462_009919 [Penicillium macrosclerotiorum]KAJ5668849.1 hypothetical protein N7462_009919 [Penicillium macrosclerotiorum]
MGRPWKSITLGVLALSRQAWCSAGDICYMTGAMTSIVDDRLYFFQGNYSTVTYDGQSIDLSSTLYYLKLDDNYLVEANIPQASLNKETISSNITVAYKMTERTEQKGALWKTDDTLFFLGGGYHQGVNEITSFNVSSETWKNVQVKGGDFNMGNRTTAQTVSVPDAGLSFIMGGNDPYINGMIRFDASNPDNISWTNETLDNGSYGVDVPNLNAGYMVYIPASTEGMLIAFGGGNYSAGLSPYSGWPWEADWNIIYVYDIASHTWWMQEASGDPPANRDQFCAVVTESPDRGAFHITTYGGWSLTDQRAYEDVNILTIPSFQWIDATELSNQTNREQQANSTIGRSQLSSSCEAYRGSQMIVLGGNVHSGAYSLTNGACSDVFKPSRVLDLSTYKWASNLNTSSTYEVPSIIYNKIGGGATGGATVSVPSAGFADATLASLIQKRVPSPAKSSPSSSSSVESSTTNSSSARSSDKSNHTNAGAIAGGVVGGVAGLSLIIAIVWYMVVRREKQNPVVLEPSEIPRKVPVELSGKQYAEMQGDKHYPEMQGDGRHIAELGY